MPLQGGYDIYLGIPEHEDGKHSVRVFRESNDHMIFQKAADDNLDGTMAEVTEAIKKDKAELRAAD